MECETEAERGWRGGALKIRRHFHHALGSLAEVCAAIELAAAIGIADEEFETVMHERTTRIAQFIHGLTK